MAEIRFTAFVEGNLGNWALKTSEPHSKKDENDQWVTVARTFRTVKAAYGHDIDFSQFREGDRVEIIGKEITEIREVENEAGTIEKYYNLVVKAEDVALASQGARRPVSNPVEEAWATAPASPMNDDSPF